MEPARLSCPFVTGPYTDNWTLIFDLFRDVDAVAEANNAEALAHAFAAVLDRPEDAAAQAARARGVAEMQTGAVEEAVDRLVELLPAEGDEA